MNSEDIAADLLKDAETYVHTPASYTELEPYKSSILLLRAKYASYAIIVERLNKHGVKVSETSLRRFCRRYNREIAQLRRSSTSKHRETASADSPSLPLSIPTTSATSTPTSNSGIRDLRGKV